MKKSVLYFITLIFILLISSGCTQSASETSTPQSAVDSFLQALQKQDYASTESYYSENMDNMANFRNQIEEISPKAADEFFKKLADFSYTINDVTIDSTDSSKATVNTTITSYDLGTSFETTVLDYIKSDFEMTFDGAKSEDIIKSVEDSVVKEINNATKTFSTSVDISLTKENDTWKLDKISDNTDFINALSGNIISTIDSLSKQLDTMG